MRGREASAQSPCAPLSMPTLPPYLAQPGVVRSATRGRRAAPPRPETPTPLGRGGVAARTGPHAASMPRGASRPIHGAGRAAPCPSVAPLVRRSGQVWPRPPPPLRSFSSSEVSRRGLGYPRPLRVGVVGASGRSAALRTILARALFRVRVSRASGCARSSRGTPRGPRPVRDPFLAPYYSGPSFRSYLPPLPWALGGGGRTGWGEKPIIPYPPPPLGIPASLLCYAARPQNTTAHHRRGLADVFRPAQAPSN